MTIAPIMGSRSTRDRIREALLDPVSSTIFVVLGQSNWQPLDQGSASWYPVVNAIPAEFKVGRWGGLWPTPCSNGVTMSPERFCHNAFDATNMTFGTVRIGDDTLNTSVYHGLVPLYYVQYDANIPTNTRNLRVHFGNTDLNYPWATAPLVGSTTQASEMVMLYMSTASGMPAASAPRLGATRSSTYLAAGTQVISSTLFDWATPGDGGVSSAEVAFTTASTSGLCPVFSLHSHANDETGALAMTPYWRLTDTPGVQIVPCGRGNFGYVASLSTAPGAGWTDGVDNMTDAGLLACLTAFKTAQYDHLVFLDCIGAADIVDGALPVDLADTVDAFHTRLRTQGAAAGFSTVEVVHVVDAPLPIFTGEEAAVLELQGIKQTLADANDELFLSLWDAFSRVELPAAWMFDDRHQTNAGARGTAAMLWRLLTEVPGSKGGVVSMVNAYRAQFARRKMLEERNG